MSFSNYFAAKVLDEHFPSTVELSLHTSDPGESGAGEVTGGGYARQTVSWRQAGARARTSDSVITFTNVTGTITHFGLWSSAGSFLAGGEMESSTILSGENLVLQASDVAVLVDYYERS